MDIVRERNQFETEIEKTELFGPENIVELTKEWCERDINLYGKMSEETSTSPKGEIVKKMITCFRGIKLDNDEEKYLSLRPDFTQYEKLSVSQCKKEFLTGMAKI